MLNFPKNQCHALLHIERRENERPADDETATINNRLIQGARLESPEQHPTGTPLTAPIKPVVTLLDPAPKSLLPVTPPVTLPGTSFSLPITSSLPVWRQPGQARPAACGTDMRSETDMRLQNIAKQVLDAQQPALEEVKDAIRDVKLHSLPVVLEWLQFCGTLCLHYDAQEDKEELSQCLEQVLLRISTLRCSSDPAHFNMAKASLRSTSIPAGFISIIQRARDSKWQNGRLNSLVLRAKIATTIKRALEQSRVGTHPEKTALQAATGLMTARHGAYDADLSLPIVAMKSDQVHRARDRDPAFTPMTTESVERVDLTDSSGGPRPERSPAPAALQPLAVSFPDNGGPSQYQDTLVFPRPIMRQAKAIPETSLLQSEAQPRPYGYVPGAYWQPTALGSTVLPFGAALAAAAPMPFQRTSEPPMPVYMHEPIKPPRQAIAAPIQTIIESPGHKRMHIDEPVERKRQRIDEDGASIVNSASSIEKLGVTWPPMSARDRAHLENIEMAFSAYEDVLSQNNMSMPTLLITFDDLRRVTHEWMILLATRPAAAPLLLTLSTITASWHSQTKASLPAEIDASSFNITIDLAPAETKALYEWSYENNPVLRQLFDFQRARIMQQIRATAPGLACSQAAAPAPRNDGREPEDAESPSQQHPVVEANGSKQNDATNAWNSLKAFEAAGIAKDIPDVQKLIDDICPILARILETQEQDERKVGRDMMLYLLSLVLQVSRRFSLEDSRKEIAQMLLHHAGRDARLCECAYDVWKNENFQGSNMLPIWTGLKKLIDHKEALRHAAAIVAAELGVIDANIATFST